MKQNKAAKKVGILKKCFLTIFLITLILMPVSCKTGPGYKKPDIPIPSDFRGASPNSIAGSIAQIYWGDFIGDEVLRNLIQTALDNNFDIKLAAERILEAEAKLGIARSNQAPTINGNVQYDAGKSSTVGNTISLPGRTGAYYQSTFYASASYEADFWGKYSSATDAAKAQLLSSQEAVNVVRMTLVNDVASAYFTLRELDDELSIAQDTLSSRQESLKLVFAREQLGVATMLDVDQSKSLVQGAETSIVYTRGKIEQQENAIRNLLGDYPGPVERGKSIDEQFSDPIIPAGLPSELMLNRPDIRKAEMDLIAANAQIGVARAAYYPSIVLTGQSGYLSRNLANLFSGPAFTWNFIPTLTTPIFNAGRTAANVKVSESQQRQALINYDKTIKQAFYEVSNALAGYKESREYRIKQQELTDTLKDQSRLSNMRYSGGVTSYLEVLDSERQYFGAEIDLARAKLAEISYVVQLYKSLGGGWKQN